MRWVPHEDAWRDLLGEQAARYTADTPRGGLVLCSDKDWPWLASAWPDGRWYIPHGNGQVGQQAGKATDLNTAKAAVEAELWAHTAQGLEP